MMQSSTPSSTLPVIAQFSSENLVLGAGVAIFHIASARVVICSAEDRHGRTYYFLPKGRRDAGEESGRGAEREGFEEVYKSYLLPLEQL
jgi:ADP-ribose pyrophosphatase YjhB (NUDIX family)